MYASNQNNEPTFEVLRSTVEWDLLLRNWRGKYNPASIRDLGLWKDKFAQAFRRIPYLSGFVSLESTSSDIPVAMKLSMRSIPGNLDGTFRDICSALAQTPLSGTVSKVAIEKSADGFCVYVAAVDKMENWFAALVKVEFPK